MSTTFGRRGQGMTLLKWSNIGGDPILLWITFPRSLTLHFTACCTFLIH